MMIQKNGKYRLNSANPQKSVNSLKDLFDGRSSFKKKFEAVSIPFEHTEKPETTKTSNFKKGSAVKNNSNKGTTSPKSNKAEVTTKQGSSCS